MIHLWLWTGGGGPAERCCRYAPAWDYAKTKVHLDGCGVWQGEGDRCTVCINRAAKLVSALEAGVDR